MIASEEFAFTYKRKPATMRVFRNNGYCWGRLNVGKQEFDVSTRRDWYDQCDEDAAQAFIRKAKRGKVEPVAGWKGC